MRSTLRVWAPVRLVFIRVFCGLGSEAGVCKGNHFCWPVGRRPSRSPCPGNECCWGRGFLGHMLTLPCVSVRTHEHRREPRHSVFL